MIDYEIEIKPIHCSKDTSVPSAILSHVLSGTAQPSGFTAEWTTLFRTGTGGGCKPQADCSADSLTRIEVRLTKNLLRLKNKRRDDKVEKETAASNGTKIKNHFPADTVFDIGIFII